MRFPLVGFTCLNANIDFKNRMKSIVPAINAMVGAETGKPSFRKVYERFIQETQTEIDLDSFADIYKSEIPKEDRFSTDEEIDEVLNARTNEMFKSLASSKLLTVDKIGETSAERTSVEQAVQMLKTLQQGQSPTKVQTFAKNLLDVYQKAMERFASTNEAYKEAKRNKKAPLTIDEALDAMAENNSKTPIPSQDFQSKFEMLQKLHNKAKELFVGEINKMKDELGSNFLTEEANGFFEDYKQAVNTLFLSSAEAQAIFKGGIALVPEFTKQVGGKTQIDWNKLSGNMNNSELVKEKVIAALVDKKGVTPEMAETIGEALKYEFEDLVSGQKAIQLKNDLAGREVSKIMNALGIDEKSIVGSKIKASVAKKLAEAIKTQDEIDVTTIAKEALVENGISQKLIDNYKKQAVVVSTSKAKRLTKLFNAENETKKAEFEQGIYNIVGQNIKLDALNDLQRLAKLHQEIENLDLSVGNSNMPNTKLALEKKNTLDNIANQMSYVIARNVDKSDFSKGQILLANTLNILAKYFTKNLTGALLNPNNLVQNITSGLKQSQSSKLGGTLGNLLTSIKAGTKYKLPNGKTIDLASLLNDTKATEQWWNTTIGNEVGGLDPLTGSVTSRGIGIKDAKSVGEKVDAITSLPFKALLGATDAAIKNPYTRRKIIEGVIYNIQRGASNGVRYTYAEAKDMVYQALTKNSKENLIKQATELAVKIGEGNNKFKIKQLAEDIQTASLVLFDAEGRPILTADNLAAIIKGANRVSSEAFGHEMQKDVFLISSIFNVISAGKAQASSALMEKYQKDQKDFYAKGDIIGAAKNNLAHSFTTVVGFAFQKGIFSWAVLTAQQNPIAIAKGMSMLARDSKFDLNTAEQRQIATENYLRARDRIGRGALGTTLALSMGAAVTAYIKAAKEDDEDEKAYLKRMLKDPFIRRLYNVFTSPLAKAYVDGMISGDIKKEMPNIASEFLVNPIISSAGKYYELPNLLLQANRSYDKGDVVKGNEILGTVISGFLPLSPIIGSNSKWIERAYGKNSPDLFDNNYHLIIETPKRSNVNGFMDAFWYKSYFDLKKKISEDSKNKDSW